MNTSLGQVIIIKTILGLIMLSLAIKVDLKRLFSNFKKPLVIFSGLIAQVIFLPAITLGILHLFSVDRSMALGLIVVASCPGGSLSNLLTDWADGDLELSVTLTSLSSILGPITIPANIFFWSSIYPPTANVASELNISLGAMYFDLLLTLGIPLCIGLYLGNNKPSMASKVQGPIQKLASLAFIGLVVGIGIKYFSEFMLSAGTVLPITLVHNFAAMGLGYSAGLFFTIKKRRTLVFEVGMQNSGLGVALILQFFAHEQEALLVCFWWGIIHITNGMLYIMAKKKFRHILPI